MKFLIIFLIIVLFFSCTFAFATQLVDEIVAAVNGEIITRDQLEERVRALEERLGKNTYTRRTLEKSVCQSMIEEILLHQEAEKQGFTVSEMEIDRALERMRNDISPKDFQEELQRRGINLEQLREKIRERLLREKIVNWKMRELKESTRIDEEQIKEFFHALKEYLRDGSSQMQESVAQFYNIHRGKLEKEGQVYLAQIVAKSEEEAWRVYEKFAEGKSFSDLAKKFSAGPRAQNGGELGWVQLSQIQNALRSRIAKLNEGQITEPMKVRQNYYRIIQVKQKKELSFNVWQEEIEEYLMRREITASFQAWVNKLRDKGYVQIMDEDLKED